MSWRFRMFLLRLLEWIHRWPLRLYHWMLWIIGVNVPRGKHRFWRWLIGLILVTADLTPIALIYEAVLDYLKVKSRPMLPEEVGIIQKVFGNSIPIHLISLNPDSFPARRKRAIAYVSFHIINYHEELQPTTLVHECVHVWQYRHFGSIYILEALWAQHFGEGYNYGGLDKLKLKLEKGGLKAFNFEQQAEIIEDAYRYAAGLPLQWADSGPETGTLLLAYKDQLL